MNEDVRACARLLLCLSCWVGTAACTARADIPRVEIIQRDVEIPGAGPFAQLRQSSTISFDHPGRFEMPSAYEAELHALAFRATPSGGMNDLTFVESLILRLGSRSEDSPEPVELARYDASEGDQPNADGSLSFRTDERLNVVEFFGTQAAYYELTITGQLPEEDWRIDVEATFSGGLEL